ncbi:MAG: hypothetical protein IPH07_01965 [Deltaproteobacteria bacterium]|nr:hypothetical protein [Deltaproteobacteria bacterium]MBK8718430.1 hypothetical protein [Deltaproteobacteria bacterium]MBP7290575.1 hypothetical protein [Nannocystaceae bacterium]
MGRRHTHRIVLALLCAGGCDKLSKVFADEPAASETKSEPPATASVAPAPTTAPAAAPVVAAPATPVTPPPASPVAAPPPKVDVHDLLAENSAPSGGMVNTDPTSIDASAAPKLGGSATPHPTLASATLQMLPGGHLSVATPPEWKVGGKDGIEGFVAPDQKLGILAAPYTTRDEAAKILEKFGQLTKVTTVEWREPKTVKLGHDELPTSLRVGKAKVADGTEIVILRALVEPGDGNDMAVVVFMDKDAPKSEIEQADAILGSIRRAGA